MSVLVVLSTPNIDAAPDSAPRRIVSGAQSLEIEVVHFEKERDMAIPYVVIQGTSTAEFEAILNDDPNIEQFSRIDDGPKGNFYKITWDVDSPLIFCVEETSGMIMDATGSIDEWVLKLWFEQPEQASEFQACCEAANVPIDITRLASMTSEFSPVPESLSPAQREALILAYEQGYFEDPREASQEDLAESLDISVAAAGRRLKRGYKNLVSEALLER